MISQDDKKFLEKRKKLSQYWPIIGSIMMVMMTGLVIYLLVKSPKLINPYLVADLIKTDKIEPATVALMALMTPVLVIFLLFTVVIVIAYVWAFVSMEKRYHKIIDKISIHDDKKDKKPANETPKPESEKQKPDNGDGKQEEEPPVQEAEKDIYEGNKTPDV